MSPIEEQYFLQQEVFTKVKYDPVQKRYIIYADDYICLNLTTRQLKILAKMCKENDIVLERLPHQMKNKETRQAFNELREVQSELSSIQNQEMKKKLKRRASQIKEQIVEGHLFFIHKLVCELYPSDLNPEEKDEIYQDIYVILVESIDVYDSDNKVSFINFLKKRILKYISDKNEPKEPDVESIEQQLEETEESEISAEYIDDTIDETVFKKVNKDSIMKLLDFITPIQRKVLILHFGLENGQPKSAVEIARIIGSSKNGVHQIIQQAIMKLKRYPYKNILLDIYEREHPQKKQESEKPYTEMWMDLEINSGRSSLSSRIEYLEEQYFKNIPTQEVLEIANKLSPLYRNILILYYGIGTEIIRDRETLSHMLGISKNAVYLTRREAMKAFKAELAKKYQSLDISDKYNNEQMVHHYLRIAKKH